GRGGGCRRCLGLRRRRAAGDEHGRQPADEAKDADNGQADAQPLTDPAPSCELYVPLPLVPLPGAPSLPLSAPRQGCRLLFIAISPQRPVGGVSARSVAHRTRQQCRKGTVVMSSCTRLPVYDLVIGSLRLCVSRCPVTVLRTC